MSQFNIDEIEKRTLSGLKDFQRATVERVDYLFRHNQNRVLVADEVGMGKTLIARGAIVKTARDVYKRQALNCTHLAAFRTATNMRKSAIHHIEIGRASCRERV